MIGEITDNIINGLMSRFAKFRDKDQLQAIREIIVKELCNYDIKRRETAVVIHDKTDINIVARFFLAKTTSGLSPKSITYYKTILERSLPQLGKKLNDVGADDIRVYLAKRRLNGVSNTTLDNERRVLSSFFSFAQAEGLIDHDPMKRVEKVKVAKQQKKPFTEEEMERLRFAANTDRDKAIIEFLLQSPLSLQDNTCTQVHEPCWQCHLVNLTDRLQPLPERPCYPCRSCHQ